MAARSLCCVLRIDDHLADGAERGVDRFDIVPLHDLPKLALLGAIGRSIDELQREAEPQAQVVVAEYLVDNETVDVAGLAYEDDLFLRVERDPLARILAAEDDVADQPVRHTLDDVTRRH